MSGVAATQAVDPQATRPGYLKPTHWSLGHWSEMQEKHPDLPWHLLEHMNCSYFSTPFRPPTLLGLKQHAQSLAVMISLLAPSGTSAEIDNENSDNKDRTFRKNESFDWLNNLQVHYNNEDAAHGYPLNSLINHVQSNSDVEGPRYHCPLHANELQMAEKAEHRQYLPYSSHMNMLMHANECLERLDHEYSAMGGIMAILPTDGDKPDEGTELDKAKKTLVGQWLLFTQQLTARMHELEISYANCLDILATEAYVPPQHISMHGPDGRSGREIVFPQDRWVLANAGDDVFEFIHQKLDQKEAWLNKRDQVYKDQGVIGSSIWTQDDNTRGIVQVDLQTRFYRLKDSGHGPIFVLPAFGDRPSTEHTRAIEAQPTVVTVPAPRFPQRTSAWEERHQNVESEVLAAKLQAGDLTNRNTELEEMNKLLNTEIKRLNTAIKGWETMSADPSNKDASLATQLAAATQRADTLENQLNEAKQHRELLMGELNVFKQTNKTIQENLAQAGNITAPAGTGNFANPKPLVDVLNKAAQGIANSWGKIQTAGQKGYFKPEDVAWMQELWNFQNSHGKNVFTYQPPTAPAGPPSTASKFYFNNSGKLNIQPGGTPGADVINKLMSQQLNAQAP